MNDMDIALYSAMKELEMPGRIDRTPPKMTRLKKAVCATMFVVAIVIGTLMIIGAM